MSCYLSDLSGLKPSKLQNVQYDSTTGKVYEELGSTGGGAAGTSSSTSLGGTAAGTGQQQSGARSSSSLNTATDYLNSYHQSYSSTAAAAAASYPYGSSQQAHYVGSFATNGGYGSNSHQLNPYDR